MKIFIVLLAFAPLVLCRIPYNFDTELSLEDLEELYELKTLTEELTRLNQTYEIPLKSSEMVTKQDVSFYVYNQEEKTGDHLSVDDAGYITIRSSFKLDLNTVFLVHGWHNNYESPIVTEIKDALLKCKDVNVIAVCWDDLAQKIYTTAFAGVPDVGKQVGDFITTLSTSNGYSLDKISIIGHSLGAHIGGYAGQETNGQISSIVGLDPAGPLYLEAFKDSRLSEDDAQYVMSIHTCAKLLGVSYRVGAADFWPNGGYNQAGCGADLAGTCAHSRSHLYYAESINSNEFIARQCDSYDNYEKGNCKGNDKVVMGGCNVDEKINGNFYLKTKEESPFAEGDTGL